MLKKLSASYKNVNAVPTSVNRLHEMIQNDQQ